MIVIIKRLSEDIPCQVFLRIHKSFIRPHLDQRDIIDHIQSKTTKCYKMIVIIKRLSEDIPCQVFLRIHKSFIRPHLDQRDIIYDKPNDEPFKNKIENI